MGMSQIKMGVPCPSVPTGISSIASRFGTIPEDGVKTVSTGSALPRCGEIADRVPVRSLRRDRGHLDKQTGIPLKPSDDARDQSGSMVSSTVLTLLVIPAVYFVWRGWSLAGRKDES